MQDCCIEIAVKELLKTGFRGTALDTTCELHKSSKGKLELLRTTDTERALGRMVRKHEVIIIGNKYPYYNQTTPAPVFAIALQSSP